MRLTKENLMLECILTDKERLDYSKVLSEKISEGQRLNDNLKSVQTQIKAEIVACEGIINSIADKLNTGKEYRSVECEIKYDFKKKTRKWIRKDTGKIVKEGIIPDEEMQEEIEVTK